MTPPITLFLLASGLAVGVLGAVRQAPSPLAAESVDRCAQQVVAVQDGEVPTPTAVRAQIALLKQTLWRAGYHEAYRAGVQLLQQPEFEDGQSLHDVVAVLGRPDLISASTSGGADLYYNTSGGPLNFGFQRCALIHKSMVTPAHWRGSDAELVKLWATARHSREWWLWHSMAGSLAPVQGPLSRSEPGRWFEVDLDGGMFGNTGTLSFVSPLARVARGNGPQGPPSPSPPDAC
jgi:hypothetical protein